jgi:hypothetical protein
MPETITQTQTSDAVLDAEQTEKVTAFLAETIREFLETNYEESEKLSTYHINLDLQDHGRDYAIEHLYEFAQPEFYKQVRQAVIDNPVLDLSWLQLPEEDTKEEDSFRELLEELYVKALERVSFHVGIVVSIQ